jgi:uncharacterized membrane protein YhdT
MDNVYRYGAMLYGMLIVALLAAKGAGHLHWAWWVVLSPIWVPVVLVIVCALIMIVGFVGAEQRGENPFE